MIPCTDQPVRFELAGEGATLVSEEVFQEAAAAVLHYFRHELGRCAISAGEFSTALEVVLHSLGLTQVKAAPEAGWPAEPPAETDLQELAEGGLELVFFQRLREELRRQLQPSPDVLRFRGLRPSVMRLTGARRWTPRCQDLKERVVDFLRCSLQAEPIGRPCGLVIH